MVGRVFLNRYEAVRLLGEGGMGQVYLARQLDLERQVVVKVMHDHIAADPKFRERFARETRVMAKFQHPYAVTLYDASLNDPQGPCIVMEYIPGVTLDNLLGGNGRLSPERCGRIVRQLCEVLQAAHGLGIVHRDLKPANIMIVDPNTPYELVKVMDFGLAKLVEKDPGIKKVTVTNAEFAVGTPGYMCPEQARGEPMDSRGDLYSVGVILFELLTGQLPFAGKSTMDMLLAHATEEPPTFAAIGASEWVPLAIEHVVQSCLAKDPADRPSNARDLAERYGAALEGLRPTPMDLPPALAVPRPSLPPASRDALAPARPSGINELPVVDDPLAIVHHLEAWMPEKIAAFKLRGFIQDARGEVMESVPGKIKVRLGGKGSAYVAPARGGLNWLGLGRKSGLIEMELRLQRADKNRDNQLRITVVLRSPGCDLSEDPAWRNVCTKIYCDLRAYLMGQTNAMSPEMARE
jgi:serine/threonine-protein kinase